MLLSESLRKILRKIGKEERFYAVLAWNESYELWFADFMDVCGREEYEAMERGEEIPDDYEVGAVECEKPDRIVVYKSGLPEFIVVRCKHSRPQRKPEIEERRRYPWWLWKC